MDMKEGYGATSSILDGDYRLIYFWETKECRLYNIKDDIGERNNLVEKQPKEARRLADKLTKHLIRYGAQRPILKLTGELVEWPKY